MLNTITWGFFIFVSTSLISLASFDRIGAFYHTIEIGDYYAINKEYTDPIGSGFELTSEEYFIEISDQFNTTPVYAIQYGNDETNHSYFIDDENIGVDGCVMDYETFFGLGEPTSLSFRGDFYDFSLPVLDSHYELTGVYFNDVFLENHNTNSVDVRGGLGQINGLDSYFQDSIRYVSSTYARSHFLDDPSSFSIDNTTVWFPFSTPYNKGETIAFADFSNFDFSAMLNDKLIDMNALFPNGLVVDYSDHSGSFTTPVAVVSDANFAKIVQRTHPYSSLAIKVTAENKKQVATAMGSYSYKFSGNDRYLSFLAG